MYLYPWYTHKYYERVLKRIELDIKAQTKTVKGVWDNVPSALLPKFTTSGLKSAPVQTFIYAMTVNMKKKTLERYTYFKSLGFNIYTVRV